MARIKIHKTHKYEENGRENDRRWATLTIVGNGRTNGNFAEWRQWLHLLQKDKPTSLK